MNARHIRSSDESSQLLRASLVGAFAVAVMGCDRGAVPPPEWNDAAIKKIETWRAEHEDSYTRNWVTIEGLHFLEAGAQTAGSAPDNDVVLMTPMPDRLGTFTVAADEVKFDPEPGAPITIDGKPATARILRDDGAEEPDVIEANGASLVVHRSGTRLSLRVRDPNGERARTFGGFDWFPISREHQVLGRFIRRLQRRIERH
jgi:uncharacterized protein (DUF1684 family)